MPAKLTDRMIECLRYHVTNRREGHLDCRSQDALLRRGLLQVRADRRGYEVTEAGRACMEVAGTAGQIPCARPVQVVEVVITACRRCGLPCDPEAMDELCEECALVEGFVRTAP